MGYVTNENIEERLGAAAYVQLTDDDGDGAANAGVVDEARLGAEGEVDSFLGRRYRLPLDLVSHPELAGVLASFTLDIVEYRLRLRRPPAPQNAIEQYRRAIEWLRLVAEGEAELPAESEVAPAENRGTVGKAVGPARVLSRDELS